MEYSIGEVSSLLNLSRDMIRYYEKQGAIQSTRNETNNYRMYDSMEVFWLLEAVMHKTWGIPISEITDIRQNRYMFNTEQFLKERIDSLEEEIAYKTLLAERLREIREQMALSMKNIGNFWVEEAPAYYLCHLVNGKQGDEYDKIRLSPDTSRFIFSEGTLPFFSNGFTVWNKCVSWEMFIEKRYVEAMSLKLPVDFTESPATYALCTHIDIGEIGEFDQNTFDVLPRYAAEHGYKRKEHDPMRGILLGRGYEEHRFHRIVRLYLPIE